MKEELKKYIEEFKIGTKTMFKEFFKKDTNKKQRANMWTFMRLITPIVTVICSIVGIITGLLPFLAISGLVAAMGAITDYFDGKSSRKHNSCSEYGKLLDQVSDKMFASVIGINLLFLNSMYIVTLLGEGIIAAINVYYKLKYKDLENTSTKIGRIKEWPLFFTLAFGYFSTFNNICLVISNISIIITFIVQMLTAESYIKRNKIQINKSKIKDTSDTITNSINLENQEKVKVLELKKSNNNSNTRQTKIEEYKKLKRELTNLSEIEKNDNIEEENNIKKKLTLK